MIPSLAVEYRGVQCSVEECSVVGCSGVGWKSEWRAEYGKRCSEGRTVQDSAGQARIGKGIRRRWQKKVVGEDRTVQSIADSR